MAKVNFYLKNPSLENSLILLFIREGQNTLKVSTGEKIPPQYWDTSKQRAKKTAKFPQNPELNLFLKDLQVETEKFLINAKSGVKNPGSLKDHVKDFINKRKGKQIVVIDTFFSVLDEFIEVYKVSKSASTINKFKTLKSHLVEFQKVRKYKIKWDNIDIRFYDKLTAYYFNDKKVLNNTFGKNITLLKTFLNWATERGYNHKIDYRKFKIYREETDIVYLSNEELQTLYSLDLTNNKKLERVRDIFCLGCFTGLRFSDLDNLKNENLNRDHILIKTQKTRETLFIPIREEAREIIARYQKEPCFLPVISNQKMNDYLKDLVKLAEIDSKITITRYRGAERIEVKKPKYDFITTHSARRTFVTLSLENGARPEVVMAITGHKDYKTFKKYIKITSKVIESEMKRVWENNSSVSYMKVI